MCYAKWGKYGVAASAYRSVDGGRRGKVGDSALKHRDSVKFKSGPGTAEGEKTRIRWCRWACLYHYNFMRIFIVGAEKAKVACEGILGAGKCCHEIKPLSLFQQRNNHLVKGRRFMRKPAKAAKLSRWSNSEEEIVCAKALASMID